MHSILRSRFFSYCPRQKDLAPQPSEHRLRLWPAVLALVAALVAGPLAELWDPGTLFALQFRFMSRPAAAAAVLLWWTFASGLSWRERRRGLAVFAAIGALGYVLLDPSMRPLGVVYFVLPAIAYVAILGLLLTSWLAWPARRWVVLALIAATWGYYALVRFDGVTGDITPSISYRWRPTAEDEYRSAGASTAVAASAATESSALPLVLQPGDWPEFRGPHRDGQLSGVRIETDWQKSPPQLVWRHRVGPGWSSFAVVDNRLFTQEQLDEEELTVSYAADTGKPLWIHQDAARFTESVAGPGPRATPTFHEGKLYVQGATGLLNCLDAATGAELWSRDIPADTAAPIPQWGFASSPLVVEDLVLAFAGGPEGQGAVAYDAEMGTPVWNSGDAKLSYSSFQSAHLGGVDQALLVSDLGLTSFLPATGKVLWQHDWLTQDVQRVTQPAQLPNGDFLVGSPFNQGLRRIHIERSDADWRTEEVWTSRALSPYYNDLVVEGEYLYGFDNNFLACVGLEDGARQWKVRGYGNGQVLLLADQKLLLVLSETGEVVLVEASPDKHRVVARFPAIEGKTWNHPVIAHGRLYVRNGEEAACYQLTELDAGN